MTNYFSHDSNARNDERILRLRRDLGARGYGIYWMLLERMREEEDYSCSTDYDTLSFDLREKAELIKKVATGYGLFQFSSDGKKFFSSSFLARMREKDSVSEKRRSAANKRWQTADNQDECEKPSDANAMQMQCKCNASVKTVHSPSPHPSPESKEKESKENNIPPISPQGGVGEDGSFPSFEKLDTSGRVDALTKLLSSFGMKDDDVDEYLRYTNLGVTDMEAGVLPAAKETALSMIAYYKAHDCPQAPYAAINAVRSLTALIPDDAEREAIIDTFRTGTLAERKKAADRVNAIITTINRRRGTPQEVNAPAAFIRKMLNS